jgi:acetoin utilization protein AcuB
VVSSATSLLNARERLFRESITVLPVVDDGKIVGLLGESDVARYLGSFRRRSEFRHLSSKIQELVVGDVMKRGVPTVRVDTPVSEAARVMLDGHMKGIPVTDKNGRLVGIVTKTDLARLTLWR